MSKAIRPCARCGVNRQARPDAVVCRDCREVLGREQYALWVSKDADDRIRLLERQIEDLRRAA